MRILSLPFNQAIFHFRSSKRQGRKIAVQIIVVCSISFSIIKRGEGLENVDHDPNFIDDSEQNSIVLMIANTNCAFIKVLLLELYRLESA